MLRSTSTSGLRCAAPGAALASAMLTCAAVIAGALTASAAELYAFQPPDGWQDFTQTNLPDRAVAVWRGPTDTHFGENILVLVKPGAGSLEQVSDERPLLAQWPKAQITKRTMTICSGHPAEYIYVVAPWHENTLISETVISVWDNVAYSATYSRLSYQQTVESARSALTTLCPTYASRNAATSW